MTMEDSPKFQEALKEACNHQYEKWLLRKGIIEFQGNVNKRIEKVQEEGREIQRRVEVAKRRMEQVHREAELMMNPHLRQIDENLKRKYGIIGSNLVCPSCGADDHGNRLNKKPWCFKCNLPLMEREKVSSCKSKIRVLPRAKGSTFTFLDT